MLFLTRSESNVPIHKQNMTFKYFLLCLCTQVKRCFYVNLRATIYFSANEKPKAFSICTLDNSLQCICE